LGPLIGSKPAGDVRYQPSGSRPTFLSARPVVTSTATQHDHLLLGDKGKMCENDVPTTQGHCIKVIWPSIRRLSPKPLHIYALHLCITVEVCTDQWR